MTHIFQTVTLQSKNGLFVFFYGNEAGCRKAAFSHWGKAFPVDIVLTGGLIVCIGSVLGVWSVCVQVYEVFMEV